MVPPSTGLLAYYQRLLSDATDDVAFVKQAQVPGLSESGYVFTTLEDRANRIYVTVNPDYYDRSLSKSAPQHILIRLKRADVAFLNGTGKGPAISRASKGSARSSAPIFPSFDRW